MNLAYHTGNLHPVVPWSGPLGVAGLRRADLRDSIPVIGQEQRRFSEQRANHGTPAQART